MGTLLAAVLVGTWLQWRHKRDELVRLQEREHTLMVLRAYEAMRSKLALEIERHDRQHAIAQMEGKRVEGDKAAYKKHWVDAEMAIWNKQSAERRLQVLEAQIQATEAKWSLAPIKLP